MASLLLDDPETERVAVSLLRHLEWQADGFSLVFLFADVGPSYRLANWLDQRLRLQEMPLLRRSVDDDFVRRPEASLEQLMTKLEAVPSQPGALWIEMQRHPHDARWNGARLFFLGRLNERRFLLERDLKRPLVLVLPADFRAQTRNVAPDIWHVRAMSAELRAPAAGKTSTLEPIPHAADTSRPASGVATPALDERQRSAASRPAAAAYLPTGARAVAELLDSGRPAEAEDLARSLVAIARQRVQSTSEDALVLHDPSISLDNVGRSAEAQGAWSKASAAYGESLAISRQLVERLGGTPESLDDLAVSPLNVAAVPGADSNTLRSEATAIYRRLAQRYLDAARYREGLSFLGEDNRAASDPSDSAPPE